MMYELMDLDSASLIGTYATEAEALAVVRRALRAHGMAVVSNLALGLLNEDGEGEQVAAGEELAARALTANPDHQTRSA